DLADPRAERCYRKKALGPAEKREVVGYIKRDSAGLLTRSQTSSLSRRVTQCACASRGHFSFLVRRTQAALGPTHKKRKTPLWGALLVLSFVIPLGFEPRTLTLKVLCSTS